MSSRSYDSATLSLIRNEPGRMPAEQLTRLLKLADIIGPATAEVVLRLWKDFQVNVFYRIHNVFDLAYRSSEERLEDACQRALFYDFHSLRILQTIISEQLDQLPLTRQTDVYGQPLLFDFS